MKSFWNNKKGKKESEADPVKNSQLQDSEMKTVPSTVMNIQEQPCEPVISVDQEQEALPAVKPKNRKTVERLCKYCHEPFTANRRDAFFCCTSHRQMANKKGYRLRQIGIPEEHFLIQAIRLYIREMLRMENESIRKQEINRWQYAFSLSYPLFISELSDQNKLVLFFKKHIEMFLIGLEKQFANSREDSMYLLIPESTREIWEKFIDMTE